MSLKSVRGGYWGPRPGLTAPFFFAMYFAVFLRHLT